MKPQSSVVITGLDLQARRVEVVGELPRSYVAEPILSCELHVRGFENRFQPTVLTLNVMLDIEEQQMLANLLEHAKTRIPKLIAESLPRE